MNEALGHALYQLRRSAGLTQIDLSKALGVEQTAVSRWERGKDAFPAARIPQIEGILDCPMGAIWSAAGLTKIGSVEQAIFADERLDPNGKRSVMAVYSALVTNPPRSGGAGGSGNTGR